MGFNRLYVQKLELLKKSFAKNSLNLTLIVWSLQLTQSLVKSPDPAPNRRINTSRCESGPKEKSRWQLNLCFLR